MRKLLLVLVLVLIAEVPLRSGAVGNGSQTCPTTGAKALSATPIKAVWVTVQAPSTNTGAVYVGGPAVSTSSGTFIYAVGSTTLPAQGNSASYALSQTFIACTASADSVTFVYGQ